MSEIPILSILIFIPVVGIFFMLLIRNNDDQSSQNLKHTALWIAFLNFIISLSLLFSFDLNNPDFQFVEKYDEWKDDENFISDVMRFLDNVLTDFIEKAPESFSDATYAAFRERSVGLGVMGLHSYFQKKMIPFESVMSKVWNKKIFANIQKQVV